MEKREFACSILPVEFDHFGSTIIMTATADTKLVIESEARD